MIKQILSVVMFGLFGWPLAQSQSYFLLQYNLGVGGGRTMSSSYASENTIGQSIIGASSSSVYQLGVGYEYQIAPLRNYLLTVYQVEDGWNLLSLPVIPLDPRKSVIYSSAVSNAYEYNGSYYPADTIKIGSGYWLKFSGMQSLQIPGSFIDSIGISVVKGWNIVGSLSTTLPVAAITSTPPGLVTSNFYGYSSGYSTATVIEPGTAYWVKVDSSGILWLRPSGTINAANRIKIVPTDELPPAPPDQVGGQPIDFPTVFALAQNYPNPFNPATRIHYALPERVYVRLQIFNVLGQVVATLVDGEQEAGTRSIQWDASVFPSGVYFYKITAGSFRETRKMLLVR